VSELNRQTAKVLDRTKAGESLEISACGANPFMYVKSTWPRVFGDGGNFTDDTLRDACLSKAEVQAPRFGT
jgi:hypothetical protein